MHKHAYLCVTSDSISIANCAVATTNVNPDKLHDEQKANALLISKAPEMLEMLEKAVFIIENTPKTSIALKAFRLKAKELIKSATEL